MFTFISGSPRNNIFTHTLNIDNACYASHSMRLFSKPFIVERISGLRIVRYIHNQKLIFKKLFWWCISFELIKKTQNRLQYSCNLIASCWFFLWLNRLSYLHIPIEFDIPERKINSKSLKANVEPIVFVTD